MMHALGLMLAMLAAPVAGQSIGDRHVGCLDRCDAGFAQCLDPGRGPDRGGDRGPLTPIGPRAGNMVTGQPYEECLLNYQTCNAQCASELAQARRKRTDR